MHLQFAKTMRSKCRIIFDTLNIQKIKLRIISKGLRRVKKTKGVKRIRSVKYSKILKPSLNNV